MSQKAKRSDRRSNQSIGWSWLCAGLLFLLLSPPVCGQEEFLLAKDGSISGVLPWGTARERITLRFGLPGIPPAKTWREGGALRCVWLTNGLRYTETVLLSPGGPSEKPLLLVNIEGENTNPEYTEASAALTVEVSGQRQPLELAGGLIWTGGQARRCLIGFLEISEAGIKVAQGEALLFRGSIPPSLKGSMTLKIPLTRLEKEAVEALADVEFDDCLRKALSTNSRSSAPRQLRFSDGYP